ncbi:Ig-like domain-containing protein [Gulosibacter bifidus]|uniref:Ig-like domain-containing protein n=1 Tax=Gulosibacter bifidus TaxID=272239 RepID=A0ABW5RIT7_9MICO|nr:Ig-like domain-containing protein [Gulosibacter bifidus]
MNRIRAWVTAARNWLVAGITSLRHRVHIAIGLVLLLAIGIPAFLHPGVPEARTDLNEGGVWVTNTEKGIVGHLNYPARTLESGLQVTSSDFDISQHERDVVFNDSGANSVATVNVATTALSTASTFDFEAEVVQGGNRSAVLNRESGEFWVMPASESGSMPLTAETAQTTRLPGGKLTANADGVIFGFSPETGQLATVTPEGAGYATSLTQIDGVSPTGDVQFTVVGDKPVVIDRTTAKIHLPSGKQVDAPNSDIVLQQPSGKSDYVVLADGANLFQIDLDSGQQVSMALKQPTPGLAAAPVQHGGCSYGAWAGSGNFLRWCDNDTETESMHVESLMEAKTPVFRVNRDVIVLNDTGKGSVWLPNDKMVLIDNWEEIESEIKADEEREDSPQTSDEVADPDRNTENKPPVANDDEFGVRPGASNLLPVLMNDSDADGDLLTASVTEPAAGIQVNASRGGAALQAEVPDSASGKHTFVYQAADGRGGTDTAKVTLDVHPWEQNEAPEQRRVPKVVLGAEATTEYNVMPDWVDPDGDMFFLEDVKAPEGIQVRFRQEGTIGITDVGSTPGMVQLTVKMSDGRKSREGTINLDVRGTDNIRPKANGDFVVVREGETATVSPLDNDVDANGDRLSLVSLSAAPPGTSVTPALDTGSFDFISSAKGTYYLTYTVTDGPSSTTGIVRIDVLERDNDSPPVAQDDIALLPTGGASLSAVLNNDFDPSGAVLVVQSVTVPENAPVQVSLVDHHLLRFTSRQAFEEPVKVSYTVSNGKQSAEAEVMVVPTSQADTAEPPQPEPDRLRVRVGDVGGVAVLENDRSVNGLPLRVQPKLSHSIPADAGTAFVTGNEVRFRAYDKPGSYTLTYNVEDDAGNLATATVTIEVVDTAEGANTAPQPEDVTAYAVAGQQTRIPIPLSGIDPDGDSVALVGVQQAAAMGVVETGTAWLEYTPSKDASGTDTFSYIVEDRFGKQTTARVRVGVAPPSAINQVPSTAPDVVRVRPNRTVSVDVLANDSDPDGDALGIESESIRATDDQRDRVSVRDNFMNVTTPGDEGAVVASYDVTDGRGGKNSSLLTVHVQKDAPLRAPMPADDLVSQLQVDEQGSQVRVSVLDNDVDPDGDRASLQLFSDDEGVTVDGQSLIIDVQEKRRQVVYGVRDQDGLEGFAVVSVPGSEVERPRVNSSMVPIAMRGGQSLTLELNQYVMVRPGRAPIIPDPASLTTAPGLKVEPIESDADRIKITADKDFNGTSSVSFDVADGDLEQDRSTLNAGIVLPVNVRTESNQPPVFRPSPLSVAVAESAVVANVCQMAKDPDGTPSEKLKYRVIKAPKELGVTISGCELSVTLRDNVDYGPLGEIEVGVDDGQGEVTGGIPVTVKASTRPLIQVSPASITNVQRGETKTIDIRKYAINPFPDKEMKIVGSPSIDRGQGTAHAEGLTLTATPSKEMLGTFTVSYTLQDATGDPERQVRGTVTLTVKDKPAPPTNVRATPVGPGTAKVTFEPGDSHGSPIQKFTIRTSGGVTSECTGTECLVSGLQNGSTHEFQVSATNEMGTSESSGWSPGVLIDVQPEQPAPPQLVPKDGAVEVIIQPTASQGSPVSHYMVTLHPGEQQKKVTATDEPMRVQFTGLQNGTAYRASVQAFNSAKKPSESSSLSREAVPFGKPAPVNDVAITEGANVNNSTGTVVVSWKPGDGNGRPVQEFWVELTNGDWKTVGADVKQVEFQVPLGEDVSAEVVQFTEFGPSEGAHTNSVRPLGSPNAPVGAQAAVVGPGEVRVTGARTNGGGGFSDIDIELQVHDPANGWVRYSSGMTLSGFNLGEPATVEFRAVAMNGGQERESDQVSVTTSGVYFEKPAKPTVNWSTNTSHVVTFTVEMQDAARGKPVTKIDVIGDARLSGHASSTFTVQGAPGDRIDVEVRACYDDGTCGGWEPVVVEIPVEYEVSLTKCADGDKDPSCHTVSLTYSNSQFAGKNVQCVYQNSKFGNQPPANGREGQVIDTGWKTNYSDANSFEQGIQSGSVQVSCYLK